MHPSTKRQLNKRVKLIVQNALWDAGTDTPRGYRTPGVMRMGVQENLDLADLVEGTGG